MDNSSIKKALLMQLMKVLSEEEMKPFKGKPDLTVIDIKAKGEEGPMHEDMAEGEVEPGSKEDRLKKLKKLASQE